MNVQVAEPVQTNAKPLTTPVGLSRIVIAGFMGAGKTTVGRLVAARLGWDFVDLDALIEARAEMTVPAIFADHGEAHFRRLESNALAAVLGRPSLVLALGGGTPEVLTNRLLLEQTPATSVVFLDAPFPALFDRCMLQALSAEPSGHSEEPLRPLLADADAAEARYHARQPLYRRLARVTVATAALTPEQTASTLLERLSTTGSPSRR